MLSFQVVGNDLLSFCSLIWKCLPLALCLCRSLSLALCLCRSQSLLLSVSVSSFPCGVFSVNTGPSVSVASVLKREEDLLEQERGFIAVNS
jgi:hypothetical protein